jgi:hypothetical protein
MDAPTLSNNFSKVALKTLIFELIMEYDLLVI